jgi:hypothetical protein
MNRKTAAIVSVFVIVVFIGYIVFDTARPEGFEKEEKIVTEDAPPDNWNISQKLKMKEGSLKAVAVSVSGKIFLGGNSYVSCYDNNLDLLWNLKTPYPVTSLSVYGDTLFASTMELILIIGEGGVIKDEWGPFEDNAIITSVASNKNNVAFADAGNKMVFMLDKKGMVKKLVGQNDGQFIVPSPYFDVALDSYNTLFVANTGRRRVETRTAEGVLQSYFGEAGAAPGAFCGCCNPSHFAVIPEGFVTAEKGLNRIKIINKAGEFIEYVSSVNKFMASIPLDLASADGKTIYAANPADSVLYIFTRK